MNDLYNIKNRGVNVFDQYLEMGSIKRATKKWYKNVFYFGILALKLYLLTQELIVIKGMEKKQI